jgi:hypothetical protein
VLNFLTNRAIQHPAYPPPDDPENWVSLTKDDETQVWEHAHWLDLDLLTRICGHSINYNAWVEDDPDLSKAMRLRAILRRKGPFVAMVDKDRRFEELIDRYSVLEDLAIHTTESPEEVPTMTGELAT